MWGQICGKIPDKGLGSQEADNNVEKQLGVILMKIMREGLEFLHVNVQELLQSL